MLVPGPGECSPNAVIYQSVSRNNTDCQLPIRLHVRIGKMRAIAQRLGRLGHKPKVRVNISLPRHRSSPPSITFPRSPGNPTETTAPWDIALPRREGETEPLGGIDLTVHVEGGLGGWIARGRSVKGRRRHAWHVEHRDANKKVKRKGAARRPCRGEPIRPGVAIDVQ